MISPIDNGQYQMSAEVVIEFYDVFTFETTINWLVEKLECSIKISQPTFYHSVGKLSDLRLVSLFLLIDRIYFHIEDLQYEDNNILKY